MAERTRLGLTFSYTEHWIAGSYYILNLIHALKLLPDKQRPHLHVLLSSNKEESLIQETAYPYLSFEVIANPKRTMVNRLFLKVDRYAAQRMSRLISKYRRLDPHSIDFCFPNPDGFFFENLSQNQRIYWIPDFQEDHFPDFFSPAEIQGRKNQQAGLVLKKASIVFSSHTAQEDFNRLYPQNECRQFVVNFAVTHPDFSKLRPAELQKKYSLPIKFFFSPNQFWQHKNHRVIFEALSILRDRSVECAVVFSGNPIDHRAPGYFDSLTAVIRELKLENNVYLLGFIDRKELLCLAQSSIAIIQPSLFEGWSTVVEDAKALRKHILLSDIPVHREQIQLNSDFFEPKSALHLADLMERVWRNPPGDGKDNYARQVANFGKDFASVLDSLLHPNFAK